MFIGKDLAVRCLPFPVVSSRLRKILHNLYIERETPADPSVSVQKKVLLNQLRRKGKSFHLECSRNVIM